MKTINKLKILATDMQEILEMDSEEFESLYRLEPTSNNRLDVIAGLVLQLHEHLDEMSL